MQDKLTIKGQYRIIKSNSLTKEIISVSPYYSNMIMNGVDTGINIILDRLNALNTYSLNITHADIGTGATPPTIADTILDVPVARTPKAIGVVTGSTVDFQFFYPDVSLPSNTYYEFGVFVDGTATISTGRIFNRALFGVPYVKSANEDTTIQITFTIT